MAKIKPIFIMAQHEWNKIEAGVQNAVVQVCTESRDFNWREPYASGQQSETRASGFFIDEEGHLITVTHGVENARLVWIQMPCLGAKILFADVLGICPDRDVALLKLRKESIAFIRQQLGEIPHLMLGSSDEVNHTDKILVLGYPLGQPNIKSSTGVISGRESGMGKTFFQITAAVNPGNSGGPIFNTSGFVIGMAVATIAMAQNVGYAVPINEISMVIDLLHKQKIVYAGSLGLRFNASDNAQALFLGNPIPGGLYINTVFENSVCHKAGVQAGDMLYMFNGYRIDGHGSTVAPWTTDRVSIHDLVARLTQGQRVPIVIFRKGKQIELEIVFSLEPAYAVYWRYPAYETIDYETIGGMVIMQLADNHIREFFNEAPDLCDYLKIENKIDPKLIISHVIPGSYAYENGSIHRGQVITHINDQPVHNLADLRKSAIQSLKNGFFTIKTTDNMFVVLSFDYLLSDEQRLARDFNYTMSPFIQSLLEAIDQFQSKAK
ncbi:N/A [soil metagenome]